MTSSLTRKLCWQLTAGVRKKMFTNNLAVLYKTSRKFVKVLLQNAKMLLQIIKRDKMSTEHVFLIAKTMMAAIPYLLEAYKSRKC